MAKGSKHEIMRESNVLLIDEKFKQHFSGTIIREREENSLFGEFFNLLLINSPWFGTACDNSHTFILLNILSLFEFEQWFS